MPVPGFQPVQHSTEAGNIRVDGVTPLRASRRIASAATMSGGCRWQAEHLITFSLPPATVDGDPMCQLCEDGQMHDRQCGLLIEPEQQLDDRQRDRIGIFIPLHCL